MDANHDAGRWIISQSSKLTSHCVSCCLQKEIIVLKCTKLLKVFRWQESTCYSSEVFGRENFHIWLNPQYSMPFQSHAWSVVRLGRRLLMTSSQEPDAMAPQSALCIFSRKWYILGPKRPILILKSFLFRHWRQSWVSIRNYKLRSSTFDNCELTAAICNIWSDDGKNLIANELLV